MIAIRGLAAIAVAGCTAIALAPRGGADPARETISISFLYDADKPAMDNYLVFARQAERACSMTNGQRLSLRRVDRACVEDLLEKVVVGMDRPRLAEIHDVRTGARADSSRTLVAR